MHDCSGARHVEHFLYSTSCKSSQAESSFKFGGQWRHLGVTKRSGSYQKSKNEVDMNIACLGWGPLTWKPDSLPLASNWFQDGPLIPIEFSRVSDGGELATAICMNAQPCKVQWAVLDVQSLDDAVQALRQREQIPDDRHDGVGVFVTGESLVGVLAEWASARQLDAVIWTALPPRFEDVEGLIPSVEDALYYLRSLTGDVLNHARSYVRQVPIQIDTPYRREIARKMGWV
jgi:hypothetical protein